MFILFNKGNTIFIISSIIYFIINLVENLFHYTIGRKREINIQMPSKEDWIKIFIVMIVFALLQGFFTSLVYRLFFND